MHSIRPSLLALHRFARLMQINPVHFAGATVTGVWPNLGCDSVWPQYTWQTQEEVASRQYLSQEIENAEAEIKRILGYSPAPAYEVQEEHSPKQHTWDGTIQTNWRKLIAAGRRATSVVQAAAAIVYSDVDGDGFDETATITVATTVTDSAEIHLFYASETEAQWEIRPLRTVTIQAGTATITADSWLFIDPDLYERAPGLYAAVDLSNAAPLLTTCDVVRVYTDTAQASVRFIWSRPGNYGVCGVCLGSGCAVCAETVQDGCLAILGDNLVKVYPATYADSAWTGTSPTLSRVPDRVLLWYVAGDHLVSVLDKLPERWARAIAFLAAARLELPVCECTNVQNVFKNLQRDMTRATREARYMVSLSGDLLTNPFGTRVGEYRAWQQVAHMPETGRTGGVL